MKVFTHQKCFSVDTELQEISPLNNCVLNGLSFSLMGSKVSAAHRHMHVLNLDDKVSPVKHPWQTQVDSDPNCGDMQEEMQIQTGIC